MLTESSSQGLLDERDRLLDEELKQLGLKHDTWHFRIPFQQGKSLKFFMSFTLWMWFKKSCILGVLAWLIFIFVLNVITRNMLIAGLYACVSCE